MPALEANAPHGRKSHTTPFVSPRYCPDMVGYIRLMEQDEVSTRWLPSKSGKRKCWSSLVARYQGCVLKLTSDSVPIELGIAVNALDGHMG